MMVEVLLVLEEVVVASVGGGSSGIGIFFSSFSACGSGLVVAGGTCWSTCVLAQKFLSIKAQGNLWQNWKNQQ